MTEEEMKTFELLDAYADRQHHCFVAEFFLNKNQTEYIVCLRPKEGNRNSPNRFVCVYLRIEPEQVITTARSNALTLVIIDEVNSKLPPWGQLG
jgi:hypothetical protein